MIGADDYPSTILTQKEWDALEQANVMLIDYCFNGLIGLEREDTSFADLEIATFLPPASLMKFTPGTLRQFITTLASVGLKMRLPDLHPLGSTAEEIALYAMKEHALGILGMDPAHDLEATENRFGEWSEYAFEDPDHELLFDLQYDGIEDSPVAAKARFANLRFNEWFVPFDPPRAVTPYGSTEPRNQTR